MARRGGERVPRERPRLVHGPAGRQRVGQLGPPAEGADGEAATDHLAEAPQVGDDARPRGGAPGPRRNPVMTSSNTSSDPAASQAARRPSRNPDAGATRFMFAATGSTMTQATEASISGTVVVGGDDRVGHGGGGDAGRPRQPQHRDPAAAAGQQRVGVAVVAAVELHDPVAPGDPAGEPERAHRRLGPRRHEADLLAPPAPARRCPRRAAPRRASACRRSCRAIVRRRDGVVHHGVGVAEEDAP